MGVGSLSGVLSSLPMLNMGVSMQLAILGAFADHMAPGARLAQYTYGWGSPLKPSVLQALGWTGKRQGHVLANLPPAHVWAFCKADAAGEG